MGAFFLLWRSKLEWQRDNLSLLIPNFAHLPLTSFPPNTRWFLRSRSYWRARTCISVTVTGHCFKSGEPIGGGTLPGTLPLWLSPVCRGVTGGQIKGAVWSHSSCWPWREASQGESFSAWPRQFCFSRIASEAQPWGLQGRQLWLRKIKMSISLWTTSPSQAALLLQVHPTGCSMFLKQICAWCPLGIWFYFFSCCSHWSDCSGVMDRHITRQGQDGLLSSKNQSF